MDNNGLESRLKVALEAGEAAAEILLHYYQNADPAVELKSDRSPVTEADRNAEALLRDRLAAAFPEDGILGEEFPELPGTSGYRWIVDPLDGTRSFIHKVPLFGTLIGLEHEGRSVLGVILLPALDEVVYARSGGGAWHRRGGAEPVPARVSGVRRLSEGLFCTTSAGSFDRIGRPGTYLRLSREAGESRGWGDCYGYVLVATGRAEVMVDPLMHIWDCAALQPILEEAGGTFTDWTGSPTIYGHNAVATNGHVLPRVLELLGADGDVSIPE